MSYVASIHSNEIVVAEPDQALHAALSGFSVNKHSSGEVVVALPERSALPGILSRLRDAGLAFAGASHGWPPAEVFADLREKGLVSGPFTEIVFSTQGTRQFRSR